MNHLKIKEEFQTFVIFEILHKFGIRAGAISKANFYEKNEKITKRKLGKKFIQKINHIISINHLKMMIIYFITIIRVKKRRKNKFFYLKIKSSKFFSKKEAKSYVLTCIFILCRRILNSI